MKNIERPEIQQDIAETISDAGCDSCPLDKCEDCEYTPESCQTSILKWFQKEYEWLESEAEDETD